MAHLDLPAVDAPEGYLEVRIAGQEPVFIPYPDYVSVDQMGEVMDLQAKMRTGENGEPLPYREQLDLSRQLLSLLGIPDAGRLPVNHLVLIMQAWDGGPGDMGESDGSETSSEPTDQS